MKFTQSLLALSVLMCGVIGADDSKCGCSANKPKPTQQKPSPAKETPKPAPSRVAAKECAPMPAKALEA